MFERAESDTLFVQWLSNSALIGLCVVAITLLVALPAGYGLARMPGRSGENLSIGIFLTYLVPPTLLFLPLARVVTLLGLQDSLWALVVVYPTFTIPFCTWLLMGFFKPVPREIEEAAIVDGCTVVGAFVKTVLPLSVPAILTVVIFAFTLTVQEFVYALTFISSSSQKPVTLGVATDLIRGDIFYWGELMGAALISSVPVAIAYNLFLDRFISGITGGAVKQSAISVLRLSTHGQSRLALRKSALSRAHQRTGISFSIQPVNEACLGDQSSSARARLPRTRLFEPSE